MCTHRMQYNTCMERDVNNQTCVYCGDRDARKVPECPFYTGNKSLTEGIEKSNMRHPPLQCATYYQINCPPLAIACLCRSQATGGKMVRTDHLDHLFPSC